MMEERKVKSYTDSYKVRVSEQYRMVNEHFGKTFREVVKFGALLNEVEATLDDNARRFGSGLKGWLEENCPDVNYKTAVGYKMMATKCAKMIGGGTQALACLQYRDDVKLVGGGTIDVPAKMIEKRDALFDEVDSRRKLEQMWFQCHEEQKGKAGRPVGSVSQYKKPDTNDPATCARAEWSRVIVPATNTIVLEAAAKLLKLQDVEDALVALKVLIDFLNDRKAELRGKR